MIKIYVWPCGTWCHEEELDDYGWMSDDFSAIWISADAGIMEIEDAVAEAIK
jgi:hypothetical protein